MSSRSTRSHQETKHTSLLFFACLHFQCWTNTLYSVHLQSNKETTVWTCAFSLYMSSNLQMAVSIHNSVANFCEDCVLWRMFEFHLTVPYTYIHTSIHIYILYIYIYIYIYIYMHTYILTEAKGDGISGSLICSKTLMKLIFNPCGEFR